MSNVISRNALSKIKPYLPGKSIESLQKEVGSDDIIKLASNENPLGCPITADQLAETISNSMRYPDKISSDLVQKIAKRAGVHENQIILGNGSDEVIQFAAFSYLDSDSQVIISEHTFSVYLSTSQIMDCEVINVPTQDYKCDLNGIVNRLTPKTKIIFLANPNNPTGTYVSHSELETFLGQVPEEVLVVLDEAYIEYANAQDMPDAIALHKTFPNLLILRTFSKIYGLAGFRIGYGIGDPSVIDNLKKVCPPFNVNSCALKAAEIAFDNQSFLQKSIEVNTEGKAYYYKSFEELGLTYLKTAANFVCVFFDQDCRSIYEALLKHTIIVRPLHSFGLPNAMRVSVGLMEQNQQFIQTLTEIRRSQ